MPPGLAPYDGPDGAPFDVKAAREIELHGTLGVLLSDLKHVAFGKHSAAVSGASSRQVRFRPTSMAFRARLTPSGVHVSHVFNDRSKVQMTFCVTARRVIAAMQNRLALGYRTVGKKPCEARSRCTAAGVPESSVATGDEAASP